MLGAGFEPVISATKRPHPYALDLAATGIFSHHYTHVFGVSAAQVNIHVCTLTFIC
jgi:hypothetical protein